MKVPVIAIYDCMIGYKNISVAQNVGVAGRGFTNSIISVLENKEFNDVSPADLSLYHIADFDSDTGEIFPINPKLIVAGTAVIADYNNKSFDNAEV